MELTTNEYEEDANQTNTDANFFTPNSTTKGVEPEAEVLMEEMDKKKLSFDNFAAELNCSPIKEAGDESQDIDLSMGTKQLKEELQNTTDKSTWEIDETMVESTNNQDEGACESTRGKDSPQSSESSGLPSSFLTSGANKEEVMDMISPEMVSKRTRASVKAKKATKNIENTSQKDSDSEVSRDDTT